MSRIERWAIVAAVILACGCGPGVKNLVWPPVANPTLDGLYPYDFEHRGLDGIKALHGRMITAKFEDEHEEQRMLYALGRAQVDAFLFAMTLDPDSRAWFLAELGEMLGRAEADEETFMASPTLLLEPFDILALKYPRSVYAPSAEDARVAFRLMTFEGLGDEEMKRIIELSKGQGPMSPFVRAALLVILGHVLVDAAAMDAGSRSVHVVDALDRYVDGKGSDWPEDLESVLVWASSTVMVASRDPDPLFIDLAPTADFVQELLWTTPFPAGLPEEVVLPERVKVLDEVEDPYRYIVVDGAGQVRVTTSIVFEVDEDGKVGRTGEKGPFAWPGKAVSDVQKLPQVLAQATQSVSALGPAGGSPLWDRAAPLAVDPSLTVESLLPLVEHLRASLDHVVIAVRTGGRARYVSADIRPNCAMAGSRIGGVLGQVGVDVHNVTVGHEDSMSLGDVADEQPLLLASRISEEALYVVGKPQPDAFVEVAYRGGQWTWGQLVAVEEGLHSAVVLGAQKQGVDVDVQSFLLPGMTMAESRQIEIQGEEGAPDPLPDPGEVDREQFILIGAYGDHDKAVQDAWLSAYLDPLSLESAATLVLDVARCWGGDYQERAVEALSKGKGSILEQVASYLGDPVMDPVARSILSNAGGRAVDVLVHKLRSKDKAVWEGAWLVLADMDAELIGAGLAHLLGDPDPELRTRALMLYGNSMPAGTYPELIPLLDDPDLLVRRWAISTAGMLGIEEAIPRLMQYVDAKTTPPSILAEALFSLGLLEVEAAVPYMIEGAGHQSAEVRESVALSLGNVGAADVMGALKKLLGDEEPTVVLGAMKSVEMIASEKAIPYLESLLDSEHPALAEAAWQTIERIRAANTVSLLEMDGEAIEAVCADLGAEQLGELAQNPSGEALDCLVSKLKNKEPEVREAACVALGERGDPSVMKLLKKRTKDKKPGVRKAAWDALKTLDKIKKKKKKSKKKP